MRFLGIAALVLTNIVVLAQTQKPPVIGTIQGIVQSGNNPIPGVTVTATDTSKNEKVTTSTDLNGQYQLKIPSAGAYVVETSMAAFASAKKTAEVAGNSAPIRLDFDLTLASRSREVAAAAVSPRAAGAFRGRGGRGGQQLEVEETEPVEEPAQETQQEITAQVQPDLATPGLAADAPTESVAVLGNTAETTFGNNFNFDREQIQQFIDAQFGLPPVQPGVAGQQGGPEGGQEGQRGPFAFGGGGGGGGRGGRGGRGGGRGGFALGRGGRGFAATGPRGNLSYQLSDSSLDAAPYAICATPPCNVTKPQYMQHQFTATVGGPLVIPHVVKTTNTNYNVSYNGFRNENPADFFSTVPTLAERAGDFSQTTIRNGANAGNPVQIFDPVTHAAFQNNIIPQSMLNPAALGLLKFVPQPNLPGSIQNFHYFTAATNDFNALNLRLNHTLADLIQQAPRRGRNGAPRARGGGGGRNGGNGGRGLRRAANINFGLNWTSSSGAIAGPFPSVGGNSTRSGFQATLGYVRPLLGLTNNSFNIQYNRNRTTGTNLYAFKQDVEGVLGIEGISENPFDWGLPNLSFTNFAGINDTRASFRRDQTIQFSDGMLWSRNRHNFRWGVDFRLTQTELHSTQNSRGTFTFTGARTAAVQNGILVQNTGYDFADFLLGLPQQTTLQFGSRTYNFRGNSWDGFIQDDWRIRGSLTIQYGLRYDYASPYTERDNQLVNLDVAPGFVAVVPVLPGATGPYHGIFPKSLVKPDRNNFSPRIGLAWRVAPRTTVRVGYGVTYNGSAYSTIAAQMANQPPFSIAQTNIFSPSLPLSLQNGFPASAAAAVTNNYGIDPNYRIGYAQTWNVDVQRDLRRLGLVLNLDYTGTKGTRLDIIEAPNRTTTGLRIAGVQPFNWEASEGNSILHSGAVRLNRRLGRGISFGGTYQFSKSIDNASTVSGAGGQGVVAQDAFDLRAERGPSAFDIRHRANINYNVELPFGTNKAFLAKDSIFKTLFGDWLLNGNWIITSGSPLTARVLGSYTDVNRGSNGSLRAQATGLSPEIEHRSIAEWFNTAAFTLPPAGQFGDVGRNTLRGPGQVMGNLSINKTFTFWDGRTFDVRVQSTNFLNMPQFRGVDTNVNSPTFGKITSAGQMRRIQIVARFNF